MYGLVAILVGLVGVGFVILAILAPPSRPWPKPKEEVEMENRFSEILAARGFEIVVNLPAEARLAMRSHGEDWILSYQERDVWGERRQEGMVLMLGMLGYRSHARTGSLVALWGPAAPGVDRAYPGSSLAYASTVPADTAKAAQWQILVGPKGSIIYTNLRKKVVEDFADSVVQYVFGGEAASEQARRLLATDVLHR